MSKLQAITNLPTQNKIALSKLLDSWIRDYETGSGDNDPSAWFNRHAASLKLECAKAGISCTGGDSISDIAYTYYMTI
jgi:hypothetical protein